MAKTRRRCRRESREPGLSPKKNYHSQRAYRNARAAWRNAKAARKRNRRRN